MLWLIVGIAIGVLGTGWAAHKHPDWFNKALAGGTVIVNQIDDKINDSLSKK